MVRCYKGLYKLTVFEIVRFFCIVIYCVSVLSLH